MLFSSRRADDADVIRARLRALLADGAGHRGWLPDDEAADDDDGPVPGRPDGALHPRDPDDDPDSWSLDPADADADADAVADVDAEARTEPIPVARSGAEGAPGGRHRAAGPATRVDPGPHGARTLWVVAVLAAVAVAGWSWLGRPEVAPVDESSVAVPSVAAVSTDVPADAAPPATTGAAPSEIVVSVVGQVASPGLVTLPTGARVADALAAAGGLLPEADPAAVNAAALLSDGQQVAVGVPGAGAAPGAGGGAAAPGPVDLNTATLADLDALPGIGPVLAQRILDHRAAHGPFSSVEELDDVSGIGPALYAEVSPLVTV